ncbi:sarcosine oxidase subunit gamma [Planotetraspora thailandica]|uniref:Sarcosine oxidase subunit gamma n=1 Tax=Planotetraspora thailandica TaxID=487172 RepID=A0A8J3V394_9ACTN|nr:sarcosine oxidase subunit gamma family protein [Planotetraspora thailandica]GII56919.1 sarcosine oxidase subunit gamma [Planotetraspora thailandica]
MAERLSPLARFTPVTTDDLRIAEVPFLTQVNLRVDPKSGAAADIGLALGAPLPTGPGTYASATGYDVLWLGPDEWLVVGAQGHDVEGVIRAAAGDAHVGVTDVSAQRTVVAVDGRRSRDLLAHGCALDLHPRVFGPGRCAQTMLARAQVVLTARESDEFRVFVRSSFAGYLAAWLLDAAVEYLPDGPVTSR